MLSRIARSRILNEKEVLRATRIALGFLPDGLVERVSASDPIHPYVDRVDQGEDHRDGQEEAPHGVQEVVHHDGQADRLVAVEADLVDHGTDPTGDHANPYKVFS